MCTRLETAGEEKGQEEEDVRPDTGQLLEDATAADIL